MLRTLFASCLRRVHDDDRDHLRRTGQRQAVLSAAGRNGLERCIGRRGIRRQPADRGLAMVLAGWLLGAFVGSAVAALITARHRLACALVIGALVAAGAVQSARTIRIRPG